MKAAMTRVREKTAPSDTSVMDIAILTGLARIFHKGRREMRESAGDAAIRAGNCLQAYLRYVENNFQEKRRRFGAFTHCSRPLVKYPG